MLNGKPLMVSGKVGLSDDCCCGTGICCLDGNCTVKTEADCIASGGRFIAGTTCDPNPCCDAECPASDVATIQVTFSGVTFCFPDSFTGDLNGTFTLTNIGTSQWVGAGNVYSLDGVPQPPPVIFVGCAGDNIQLVTMGPSSSEFFTAAEGACPPGPTSNQNDCGSFLAFGGTATISP